VIDTVIVYDPALFAAEDTIPQLDPGDPEADIVVARMMRRLRSLDARKDRTLRIADAEYAAIKAWTDEQLAPIEHEAANLRRIVEGYALAVRDRSGGRTKSIAFPAGTVKTTERETWEWPDDTAALLDVLDDLTTPALPLVRTWIAYFVIRSPVSTPLPDVVPYAPFRSSKLATNVGAVSLIVPDGDRLVATSGLTLRYPSAHTVIWPSVLAE
jgi:hypothetical protein